MIGRPSPKTFPSILNNMCAPCRCVSRREAHGWVKGTCALSKGAAKCRLKVLAWARKESMQLSADDISASHSLAKIALDPATKPELKVRCFAELAQYVYPKRKAVDLALNEWEENRSPKVVIEYIGRPDRTSQPAS